MLAVMAAGLAGCGGDPEDAWLAGTWTNPSGSLVLRDGVLTRRAGRITQTGRYTLHDMKSGTAGQAGRLVLIMDGQKLDCRFTVEAKALTLAEPCATNFDGGKYTRAG